ncbi:MAG: Fe-S cluster assembly protein SufB [Alphaproteobacteria bacterium]|nr:Fe-S cluster assembly protein SufB [Alphaproteobacteria bacterium]
MKNNKNIIEKISSIHNEKVDAVDDIDTISLPVGLSVEVIKEISRLKDEPEWMLKRRLFAYKNWLTMKNPTWSSMEKLNIDFNKISYFAKPESESRGGEISPELKQIYDRLGVPLDEQEKLAGIATIDKNKVAVDIVLDSVSVGTTYQKELKELGIIFCPFSQAIKEYPELVKKYMGTVISDSDNFFSCLNTAVFSDGTFVYIPKGVKCPIDLASYFRINTQEIGQFERTLIIAEDNSTLSYLEGCSAPRRVNHQLHGGVVEIVLHNGANVKYSTVQNWYKGSKTGKGGILNYVSKRAICLENSKMQWLQMEVGSAKTWKYPSCILKGDNSYGEFLSTAVSVGMQEADTGTKMIHIGKNTTSKIISKGIATDNSNQTFRSLVKCGTDADNMRNFTKCDSLILDSAKSITVPTIDICKDDAIVEHEATTGKISDEQLFYLKLKGVEEDTAVSLIVSGFFDDIIKRLPNEFALEAKQLIHICLDKTLQFNA